VDLGLSDEQKLLADTVRDLLDKRYDSNTRLELLRSEAGWSRDMWRQYAELGLLGLTFDEADGGVGMGAGELAVVMEAFGRALVLEPFVATVLLGGALVAAAGSADQRADVLPAVVGGETLLALAATEAGSRWSFTDIAATATPDGDQWTVTGDKIAVLGGDAADRFVVTATKPDGRLGLFLVPGSAAERAPYPMQDGQRGADVRFAAAPGQELAAADAEAALADVIEAATAALCAEAVGAMDRMLWLTVDFLKTRVQFGQPIAVFQTLQHRAADMYVSLEQARSMAVLARLALDEDDPRTRRQAVRAAKIQIDRAGRHIGEEAVQLHGGIGMTMEYPVGHYLKRITVIAKTFADTDQLVDQLGADGGLVDPA
jgi:alkylation response protein AidB-like acyl-CoA dehydrogenase